jgi:hypothetical protein
MVAACAYGRQKDQGQPVLPVLLEILDDKYLLNRQFGQLAVEAVWGQSLEKLGYHFAQSPEERAVVLPKVRERIMSEKH